MQHIEKSSFYAYLNLSFYFLESIPANIVIFKFG